MLYRQQFHIPLAHLKTRWPACDPNHPAFRSGIILCSVEDFKCGAKPASFDADLSNSSTGCWRERSDTPCCRCCFRLAAGFALLGPFSASVF